MPLNQVQRLAISIAATNRYKRLHPDRKIEPVTEEQAERIRAMGLEPPIGSPLPRKPVAT